MSALPQSVLFCCDHNAVRSPMAEGLMKRLYGMGCYIQSAGVENDLEIDGFAIAACAELGVALDRHRSRSFDEMAGLGDDLSSFDLIVALSDASHLLARDIARTNHLTVEHWPISDPTGAQGGREARLDAYRKTRDEIVLRLTDRFGPGAGFD
ncbi:MAG: arsenate-mycothiol transferase ArsC [Paracoccaceae bacterium]